ncbi:reverse transcriptase domain-containing protein [Desulfatibacillum alkenivorans]|uniref:reverse transcriptase domain-containing protein n=1 Tax=Desulfatibacillum alkenivorans TaxID=259354 RepID=UPI001B8CA5C0|nr:reverse transcriptase domain-containing protein [Desulfatibacillum alkenivorans]
MDGLIKAGYTYVVDDDLASYFDTIPHEGLMNLVEERISDGRILDLVRYYLGQDVVRGGERWTPIGGAPQGTVISPLLANLYLHPLDCRMRAKGFRMAGYADGFSEADAPARIRKMPE